jgi:hypothetical protein
MDDETIEKIEHMKMTYNLKKKPIDLKWKKYIYQYIIE